MILAILQARMSSTRLPGKVLKPILGRPMLELHLERLSRMTTIDRLVVATSTEPEDTPIVDLCDALNVDSFRGSLDDVLDRYYRTAMHYGADALIRLTGDCPLADPAIIDQGVRRFVNSEFDYVGNCMTRTFPIGLDFEVLTAVSLQQAWREAVLPSEREHVTPFIKNHPERFAIESFTNDIDYSHHRWTVDEPEDFEFVTKVYEALYPINRNFAMHDILRLLEKCPDLRALNYHIVHGEGYRKSLRQDERFPAEKIRSPG